MQRIDDYLLHEKTEGKLLEILDGFWKYSKLIIFACMQKMFCFKESGILYRFISKNGIKLDPRNLKPILEMIPPNISRSTSTIHLCSQLDAIHFPEYSKIISPLQNWLEVACKTATKVQNGHYQKLS